MGLRRRLDALAGSKGFGEPRRLAGFLFLGVLPIERSVGQNAVQKSPVTEVTGLGNAKPNRACVSGREPRT